MFLQEKGDGLLGFPAGPAATVASSWVVLGGVTSLLVNTTLGSSESPAAGQSLGHTGGIISYRDVIIFHLWAWCLSSSLPALHQWKDHLGI